MKDLLILAATFWASVFVWVGFNVSDGYSFIQFYYENGRIDDIEAAGGYLILSLSFLLPVFFCVHYLRRAFNA